MISRFSPGDLAREFARKQGWMLSKRNIMVEGDKDVRYFQQASRLHFDRTGLRLIGLDLAIFAPGSGDRGGVPGMCEMFPILRQIIDSDLGQNSKPIFRVVALLDNDEAGTRGAQELLRRNRAYRLNRDVYLLQRTFPRRSSEPSIVAKHIEDANSRYNSLDCDIENLLSSAFVEEFLKVHANALSRPTVEIDGEKHYSWTPHGKDQLSQHCSRIGTEGDLSRVIDTLKSFRHYLGLNSEGISP